VEAVFFFRWDLQTARATYRRISGSNVYTKNYFQASGAAKEVLDEIFGRSGEGQIPLQWRWPNDEGGRPGKLRPHKGDKKPYKRVHLSWDKGGQPPLTWKLGDPATEAAITIAGDPSGVTEAEADAAIQAVFDADVRPWFVAVKLEGEEGQLHARAYLENPPPGMEHADVALLPAGLLAEMKSTEGQTGVFRPGGSDPAVRVPKIVARIEEALERDPNVLLVGPPGTGKTVALEDMRSIVEQTGAPLAFDPDRLHDCFDQAGDAGKVTSLVFHSSFAYENFVAGLVPRSEDGELRLEAQPGPLINLATWAGGSERRALLLLDEFNRGPTAAIFGDTLALLDGSKRAWGPGGGAHIARPFAGQEMSVPREYANAEGSVEVHPELRLPGNLQIVAALNSSDRSVAPLDAALRRRFAIVRVEPDLELLAEHFGVEFPDELPVSLDEHPETWGPEEIKLLALRLLATVNERIGFVLGDDFLLGHALFWPVGDGDDAPLHEVLCGAFDQRVVQSLRLSFVDQDDLLAAVLGVGMADAAPPSGPAVAVWRQPPPDLEAFAQAHLELRSVVEMGWEDAARAMLAVVKGAA
jgi:5-methylcytosine-specific restriction protein B